MQFPEFAKHTDKQKALDNALWLDFVSRTKQKTFSVINIPESNYLVIPTKSLTKRNLALTGKPHDYFDMSFNDLKKMKSDIDPLWHWEEIIGMFSVADGEILRFLLRYRVPIQKIIALELANRGYDENNHWVGFEKAEGIWLKS